MEPETDEALQCIVRLGFVPRLAKLIALGVDRITTEVLWILINISAMPDDEGAFAIKTVGLHKQLVQMLKYMEGNVMANVHSQIKAEIVSMGARKRGGKRHRLAGRPSGRWHHGHNTKADDTRTQSEIEFAADALLGRRQPLQGLALSSH